MVLILVLALVVFAVIALLVWWLFDIDVADIVSSVGSPIAGLCLLYWYDWDGAPLAWAGGIALLAIGAFSLYFLVRRRTRPSSQP
ncbi:MAG TPA: hypothetical protein VMW68_06640 [Methyloceanibacter sp.]|nr:hypothetical protein [Methyloceanibacter sp.]